MSKKILAALILLSVIAALAIAFARHGVEKAGRTVEIAIDYTNVKEFSRANDLQTEEVLDRFRRSGLTAVAFSEDTLDSLRADGFLKWSQGTDFANPRPGVCPEPETARYYVSVFRRDTYLQLKTFLPLFMPGTKEYFIPENETLSLQNPAVFEVSGSEKSFYTLGLGFNASLLKHYGNRNFHIILRPENKTGVPAEVLRRYQEEILKLQPFDGIVFGGQDNEVLGYPNYLPQTAEFLRATDAYYGVIEAPSRKAAQKGSQTLAFKCADRTVRVQAIPVLQQPRLSLQTIADKFALGAAERNIRLVYLRCHTVLKGEDDIVSVNLKYIEGIGKALEEQGLSTGRASTFSSYSPPLFLLLIMGAGTAAAWLWFFGLLGTVPGKYRAAFWVLWAAATLLLLLSGNFSLWKKVHALLAGILFPILGLYAGFGDLRRILEGSEIGMRLPSLVLLRAFAVTLAGALILCGFLSGTEFFVQADQFRGIKLLMVLPPLALTALWLVDLKDPVGSLKRYGNIGVKYFHVFVMCLLGGAGIYYLLRTGNAGEGAVSGTELLLRDLLHKVLPVRPRFKEIFLGYPAIMLTGALGLFSLGNLGWIAVLAAGIGLSDITDTFAHLHTPVAVSAVRAFLGAFIGWLVGTLLLQLISVLKKAAKKTK